MNGTNDAFVPTYSGGMVGSAAGGSVISTDDMINIWTNNNNCNMTSDSIQLPNTSDTDQSTVTKYTYNDCSDFSCIVHYKIFGGGHTWPGEIFHVPFTGTTNEDINATEEIWNFFNSKSKDSSTNTLEFNEDLSIKIFPNPFVENFTIILPSNHMIHTIEILDLHGETIWRKSNIRYNEKSIMANLRANLENGMYLLNCYSTEQGLVKSAKILKMN